MKLCIQAWEETWLNLAGNVVLLKSILTSLPIYQNSILLAPKTIFNKIDTLLRRFLWEGGKQSERKLHLVSWEKIKNPILESDLQIRDIATQNLSLGAKILWNLISSKSCWSKEVLWKKYFSGKRIRCLECPPKVLKGSPILTLHLRSLDHFNYKLT
jgi:hypothetical protein